MGRPKGGKNIMHSKEEKKRLVKRNLKIAFLLTSYGVCTVSCTGI